MSDQTNDNNCVITGLKGKITRDQLARLALDFCPEAEVLRITIKYKKKDQDFVIKIDLLPYKNVPTYVCPGSELDLVQEDVVFLNWLTPSLKEEITDALRPIFHQRHLPGNPYTSADAVINDLKNHHGYKEE